MAVFSNYERHHLNRAQAEAFARAHKLPLVRWRLPLTGRAAELLDASAIDNLYENEPGLWGTSRRGAPAMLTENIQPTKYLVNGASGYMHSLSFRGDPPAAVADGLLGGAYEEIILEDPPMCINFQVNLPDGDDGSGIDSLVDDAIVVPTLRHSNIFNFLYLQTYRLPRIDVPLGIDRHLQRSRFVGTHMT